MAHWYEYRWQKGFSRYYKIFLYKDLLGDWMLTRVWGGLNSKRGNYSHQAFSSYELANRRVRRGYIEKAVPGADYLTDRL